MAIVVVGGHTRSIGKTSVVAEIIAGTRDMRWSAFKITQFGHGVCSANGKACECETADHALAMSQERGLSGDTDSSRYLQAGAERSFWVRTRLGQLAEAMPRLRAELGRAENALIESNSVLRFLRPDVYVSVLDPAVADFKESARRYLDRADAVLVPGGSLSGSAWKGVSPSLLADIPVFATHAPRYCSEDFLCFLQGRLAALKAPSLAQQRS